MLTAAGYKFEAVHPDEKVETPRRKNETALQYAMRMAQAKVLNVSAMHAHNRWVRHRRSRAAPV